jgi:mono/diheme cytochrome c family protein
MGHKGGMRFLLSLLVFGLAACANPPPAPDQATAQAVIADPVMERGRDIIARHCATCHAVTPTGRSPHPPAPSLARLSETYPVTALEEALAEGMIVGHPDMPEFRLGPQDIRAVIAYLQSIQIRRGA